MTRRPAALFDPPVSLVSKLSGSHTHEGPSWPQSSPSVSGFGKLAGFHVTIDVVVCDLTQIAIATTTATSRRCMTEGTGGHRRFYCWPCRLLSPPPPPPPTITGDEWSFDTHRWLRDMFRPITLAKHSAPQRTNIVRPETFCEIVLGPIGWIIVAYGIYGYVMTNT